MDDKYKYEDVIKKHFEENKDEIYRLEDEELPDFDKIEQAALAQYMERRRSKRRVRWGRVAIAAAMVIVLYIAALFTLEIPEVRAFTFEVKEFTVKIISDEEVIKEELCVSEVQKIVNYDIETVPWIPDGFDFKDMSYEYHGQDVYTVYLNYHYKKKNIVISMINDTTGLDAIQSTNSETFKKTNINGRDTWIQDRTQRRRFPVHEAWFINNTNLLIHITGDITEEELFEIVKNMD